MRPIIMTPGPTSVRENVRMARATECTNPDLDLNFYDFYRDTCERLGQMIGTEGDVRILSGEGILGLEAACATLTESGDRVLVIDNGIFGEGFGDFAKMYGADVVYFKGDRERGIDTSELDRFLQKDSDFKYATVVHCDTPSGVLNPIEEICPMLKSRGIITVVDAVASTGGHEIRTDEWRIDICLGGSQKALSAPPGLTFLSISSDIWRSIEERKTPVAGFYCNLGIWRDYYEKKWFPYTMPISDIKGLRAAVDNLLEEDAPAKHKTYAEAFRKALREGGLELYTKDSWANTVSVVRIPEGLTFEEINDTLLKDYNLMIAGAFGYLAGKVFRIGHMGEGADRGKLIYVLNALEGTLKKLNFKMEVSMEEVFLKNL